MTNAEKFIFHSKQSVKTLKLRDELRKLNNPPSFQIGSDLKLDDLRTSVYRPENGSNSKLSVLIIGKGYIQAKKLYEEAKLRSKHVWPF